MTTTTTVHWAKFDQISAIMWAILGEFDNYRPNLSF